MKNTSLKTLISNRNEPCSTCPYAKSTPLGVWHLSEYEKLKDFDGETFEQSARYFLCHSDTKESKFCQGWLECHGHEELLGLRMAKAFGVVSPDFKCVNSGIELYRSGQEVLEANVDHIDEVGDKTILAIRKAKKIKELKRRIQTKKMV